MLGAHGLAVCAVCKRSEYLARALFFFARRLRAARENLAAARRIARTQCVVRPIDGHAADVRDHRDLGGAVEERIEQRVARLRDDVLDRRIVLLDEGRRKLVRACRHGKAHLPLGALLLIVLGRRCRCFLARLSLGLFGLFRGRRRGRLRDVEERNATPVEGNLELLVGNPVADVDAIDGAHEIDADQILRIEREKMLDANSPPCAERQTLEVLALHEEVGHIVSLELGRHRLVADCETADLRRGVRISLDQHRRDPERACDVVESKARVIHGQQALGIDFERQKIANRVFVFGSVEPMERGPAGIRTRLRRCIELAFEIGDELRLGDGIRSGLARRRHHARTELPHDLFPNHRIARHVADVHAVEVKPREERHGRRRLLVVALDAVGFDEMLGRDPSAAGGGRGLLRARGKPEAKRHGGCAAGSRNYSHMLPRFARIYPGRPRTR